MSCHCLYHATTFCLAWYPGDNAGLQVQLYRADRRPFDLTGASVACRLAASDQPGAALLWDLAPAVTDAEGTLVTDARGGGVLIIPGATLSAALAAGLTYPAAITVTRPGGMTLTWSGYLETRGLIPAPASPS